MILDALESKLPRWMVTGARRYMGDLVASLAAPLDAMAEAVLVGRLASHPGQVHLPGVYGLGGYDNVDALPLIGRDRMIRRGLEETPWDYAERLRKWRRAWARSATAPMLLEQLAGILSPDPPVLRLVSANGTWWSRYEDGSLRYASQAGDGLYLDVTGALSAYASIPHLWDWDGGSQPTHPEQGDASRFWVVIYAPCNLPHLADDDDTYADVGVFNDWAADPTNAGAGASPEAGTIGTASPRKHVELVRGLVQEWRAAGLKCSHVIISFDASAFNPNTDTVPSSVPDGLWGWPAKIVGGARVPSRFPDARYWPGDPGGLH